MRNVYLETAFLVVLTISVLGFRGTKFTHPPMDVFPELFFPGMKQQPKYKNQGASKFFADGRADRPLPAGVVAANYGPLGDALSNDSHLVSGKMADGSFAPGFPETLEVDLKFLAHGKDRFTIFCAPCHGALGDGTGLPNNMEWVRPPRFMTTVCATCRKVKFLTLSSMARVTCFPMQTN